MEIQNYKPIGKGCLVGKFDLEIKEWGGLIIHECMVFKKNNQRWISLPSREFQSKDGLKKHFNLIKFNAEVFKRLEKSALSLLDKVIVQPQQQDLENFDHGSLPF